MQADLWRILPQCRQVSARARAPTKPCHPLALQTLRVVLRQHYATSLPRRVPQMPTARVPVALEDNFAGAASIRARAPEIHSRLRPSLLRPTLFALLVASGTYIWAAGQTNVVTAEEEATLRKRTRSFFSREITDADLAVSRRAQLIENAKKFLRDALGPQPDIKNVSTRLFTLTLEWWINKSEAQRTCLGLIGLQSIVFLAWRINPRIMARSFTHYPLSGRSYTMLTSVFSHQSGLHFLFNSIAFYSFGSGAMEYLWQPNRHSNSELREATSRYHFIALFVAAGLASSLVSHVYTLAWKLPRLIRLGVGAASPILPSLGASGSIYATVVVTALAYPDSRVNLIFLPFFTFPIGAGVGAMVAMDAIGLIRGWRFFDHAAHLGGAGFGFMAYSIGGPCFDWLRNEMDNAVKKQSQIEVN